MSVQLTLADLLVEAVKKPRGEESSSTQSSSSVVVDPNSGSSAGEKHFNRVARGNSAPSTQDSQSTAAPDSSTQDYPPAQASIINEIYYSLALATMNSCAALQNQSSILQMTSDQSKALSQAALTDQANLNTQLDEQAKKQKHMKILGWVVKSVAVVVTIAMIAGSGGVLAAPLTTALMIGLTSLTIAAPDLINNQIIAPIAAGLENAGVPPKWAEAVAILVVFTAVLLATAGAGAADSAFAGRLASEASGSAVAQKMVGTAVEEGTLQYGTLRAANMIMSTAELLAATQLITKILLVLFPDNPNIDRIIGTSLTIVLALAGGIAGGSLLSSSGYLENALGENAENVLKKVTLSLRLIMSGAQGGESYILFNEGKISDAISKTQSSMKEIQSLTMISNMLMESTQNAIKETNSALAANGEAIQSTTLYGEVINAKTAPAA